MVVSPAPTEGGISDVQELSKLGLRNLRKVAKHLGLPQKVDGKDRSKASFVEALSGLFQTERRRVKEALAAVG